MKLIEHDAFFVNLFLNGKNVAVAPSSCVFHFPTRQYRRYTKLRFRELNMVEYICESYPQFRKFVFSYLSVYCFNNTFNTAPTVFHRFQTHHKQVSYFRYMDRLVSTREYLIFVGIVSFNGADALEAKFRKERMHCWSNECMYAFFKGSSNESDHSFGDIVWLGRTTDTYTALTYNVMSMFRWVARHVHSRFVVKIDLDTWISIPMLFTSLVDQYELSYGGVVVRNAEVVRPHSKNAHTKKWSYIPHNLTSWSVPTNLYARRLWPAYAKGGGYVLSMHVLRNILTCLED